MSDLPRFEEQLRMLADVWDEDSDTALWLNGGANEIARLEARVKELETAIYLHRESQLWNIGQKKMDVGHDEAIRLFIEEYAP